VDDADVRWQFAVQLGLGAFPFVAAETALLKLVQDDHEYVSRMALQALGRIGSTNAEPLCERAWGTGDEYQRIMALWVLKDIKSVKLKEYLSLAKADGRRFVISNAIEVEQGTATSDV
jgi:HEAT repeat protein